MTTRRDFITLLGSAAAAWPVAGRAQQDERMRRIGVLMNRAEVKLVQPGYNRSSGRLWNFVPDVAMIMTSALKLQFVE